MVLVRDFGGATIGIAAVTVLLALLYADVVRDMALQWWDDPNYSHGFLIPLFSAYVIWERREHLRALPSRGSSWGLVLLAGAMSLLLLGVIGSENFLMRSSLVVAIAGLVLFHRGRPTLAAIAFPILFLFFMVPLPAIAFNAIAFPLQGLAAKNATWTIEQLGMPVLRDGNVIHLSQISLGVTEACSGI